jgi:hypothetical protein
MTGGSGNDYFIGNSGNDTIVGAQNDKLFDGGSGTDTLNIGANFTSTSDAQIVRIENVTLTAAATLNLSSQTEGFTITGSAGADSITAGSGNDTIVGAQNDALLDGGAGSDTLTIGASFASTSDAQIANIENVTLTASGTTLNLSNQTEGFNITGSSGADTIVGGGGNDTITGGAGADTMTGGVGADTFVIATGANTVTIGGSGNSGTITGYDVITDFNTSVDKLDLQGTAAAAANTTGRNGTDSTLTIGGATVKSHAISNGIITFDDANTYAAPLNLTSTANVAAVVQYLAANDIGTTGSTVAFTATISGVAHTYVYEQLSTGAPRSSANYLLVDLAGVTLTSGGTSVSALISAGRIAPAGAAGEPINLALSAPTDHADVVTVTLADVPHGWSLSSGSRNADGSWTIATDDVGALSISTPADYTGAMAFQVTMSWTKADGSIGITTLIDNVEAYAPGNPIFALAGDDNLTGSSANDLLVFGQPIAHDIVRNFDVAHDQADLLGFIGTTSFADVLAHLANDASGNAVLTLGEGMTITFAGVDMADLSAANFVFDQDPATINAASMVLSNGSVMPLSGTVENSGTIALDAQGSTTELQIIQHGITLQGGGSLVLSDSAHNIISGTGGDVVFTNVDNTISGAGQIHMSLVNQGTINASGSNALEIDTGASAIVNSGTLESSGSGGLVLRGDVSNSGLLWANGSSITVEGNVIGSGSALIDGNGTFVFDGLFAETLAINANASGTLVVSHASSFSGAITGFNADDHIFLADVSADTAMLNYTANPDGSGGVLIISDGTHATNIALQGQYDDAEFQFAANPMGGTSVALIPHTDHVI